MSTKLYVANTEPLKKVSLFEYFYELVPEYRQKKIDFFLQNKDKYLSLGAGVLLSYALKIQNEDESNLLIRYTLNGKPFFENRSNLFFSLSHSNEMVMCALSSKRVGCDVEFLDRQSEINIDEWTTLESYSKAFDIPVDSIVTGLHGNIEYSCIKTINLSKDYIFKLYTEEKYSVELIDFDELYYKQGLVNTIMYNLGGKKL